MTIQKNNKKQNGEQDNIFVLWSESSEKSLLGSFKVTNYDFYDKK